MATAGFAAESEEMPMADGISPKPPERVRGRPFEKGRSGNPAGRRTGSHNTATTAAAPCRERTVKFELRRSKALRVSPP